MALFLDAGDLSLAGWTPFRAAWHEGRMIVDWCRLAERPVEPFFYESVVRAMTRPFNLAFRRRTLADDLARLPPGLAPSGFVFHWSRCGSTLAAQCLAAVPGHTVISEASPLQNALRADQHGPASPEQATAWFSGLVNAYGQPPPGPPPPGTPRLFVKFSAADLLDLPRIEAAFPAVPWLFLYRDLSEVLASQAALGSAEFMPGAIPAGRLGLDPQAVWGMDRIAYRAHVLAALGRTALTHHRPGRSLILPYRALPGALLDRVPAHFGFAPTPQERAALAAATRRDAKQPGRAFSDDGAAKRARGAAFRETAEAIAGPVLAALDAAAGFAL